MKKNTAMKWLTCLAVTLILPPVFIPVPGSGQTVTDIDGNVYQSVMIGSQCWMAENLKVTRYRNGDTIPCITEDFVWKSMETGGMCVYHNDSANAGLFGGLYNWDAAADARNICPAGWHLPEEEEWDMLMYFLGKSMKAGGPLKATSIWLQPNRGATNETGFTALPAGLRNSQSGSFSGLCESAWFWSATQASYSKALVYKFYWGATIVQKVRLKKANGVSVRCVKD